MRVGVVILEGEVVIGEVEDVIEGRRAGAIFNLGEIEKGQTDDPAILPSDRIVVGTSVIAQGYRDLLQAVPLIGLYFRYF